ncbi:hypothetical protein, partial [Helicobacter burdigaliensis]
MYHSRKMQKLLRDPRLFFSDMASKRIASAKAIIGKITPKKYKGFHKYAIVSAVYNVEKYLE